MNRRKFIGTVTEGLTALCLEINNKEYKIKPAHSFEIFGVVEKCITAYSESAKYEKNSLEIQSNIVENYRKVTRGKVYGLDKPTVIKTSTSVFDSCYNPSLNNNLPPEISRRIRRGPRKIGKKKKKKKNKKKNSK